MISAGVGETAHDVERYLEKFFYLSHRWGCIILFDEGMISGFLFYYQDKEWEPELCPPFLFLSLFSPIW